MRHTAVGLLTGSLLVLLCWTVSGCAGGGGSLSSQLPPQTAGQLLSAAGFKQVYPSTPALKAKLQNLPQHQIFLISRGTKVYYVYADASGCGCLYRGTAQAYQNFQNLAVQAELAAEQYQAAIMNAWDWEDWGPGWWGETGEPD
jgi:hypothetical protein